MPTNEKNEDREVRRTDWDDNLIRIAEIPFSSVSSDSQSGWKAKYYRTEDGELVSESRPGKFVIARG